MPYSKASPSSVMMVVAMAMLTMLMLVFMFMLMLMLMFMLFFFLIVTFNGFNPSCRSGYFVKVESVSVYQFVEVNIAIVTCNDFGFRLKFAQYGFDVV